MGVAGAVVVGGYVNGLGLVRALAARDIPVAVINTKPFDIAHRSRWVRDTAIASDLEEQPQHLLELLDRRAHDWAGWAVFPTNDAALAALALEHERLSSTYRIISPPAEVARYFLDKQPMLELARGVGLDTPHCYGPASAATAALPALRFPVIVKPRVGYRFASRFGCKLFAARNADELSQALTQLAATDLAAEVVDYIPGPDSQIYAYCTYINRGGEPCGGITVRKLRQSPPFFGVARAAEVVDDIPLLRDATITMLRKIGFHGIAAAEFKLDPRDSRFRFLEINGRAVLYNRLLRQAGLDVSGLAWADQVIGQPQSARPNGWRGVWIHLHADILYSLLYRRHDPISLADFLAPYRRAKIYAVWSAGDPAPFFTQWSRTARDAAATLWRGGYRQATADRARPHPPG